MKRRGNPNWGKNYPDPSPNKPTGFKMLIDSLGIGEQEFDRMKRSRKVTEYVFKNYNHKYVPEPLLELFGVTPLDALDGYLA